MGREMIYHCWCMRVHELQLLHPDMQLRETNQRPNRGAYCLEYTLHAHKSTQLCPWTPCLNKQLLLLLFRSVRNTHWWVRSLGIQSNKPLFIIVVGLLLLSHWVNPLSWWTERQMERGRETESVLPVLWTRTSNTSTHRNRVTHNIFDTTHFQLHTHWQLVYVGPVRQQSSHFVTIQHVFSLFFNKHERAREWQSKGPSRKI